MVHQPSAQPIRLKALIAALEKIAFESASKGDPDPSVVIFANQQAYLEPRGVRLLDDHVRID